MTDPTEKPLPVRLAEALGDAYTIEGEIGRGGMGVVYRARDERLKRRVAIKVLPPELAFQGDIRERFSREAQTAARLSHPHVVPIFTVGEGSSALVYFIMGYVDGESLSSRIQRRGQLPVEEVRRIMKETADALSAAHGLAIIHRDIKPDNILLEGTRGRVMVTDFGIAKALSSVSATLTSAGVAIGTPSYMSPEQAAGEREIDGRSDIYSLGVVAYQMATGELPFQAATVAGILMKQITEPAPMVSAKRDDIPEDLGLAIARCLEKDPENRWPTADALRRSLENRTVTGYRPTGQVRRPNTAIPPSRSSTRSPRPGTGARPGPGSRAGTGTRNSPPPRSPRPSPNARGPLARQSPDWDRPAEWEGRSRRPSRETRDRNEALLPDTGEPAIVQKVRNRFATWAATSGGCFMINVATGIDTPWFLFVAGAMGIGLLKEYAKLWQAGYSWRDVFNRPVAHDSMDKALGKGGGKTLARKTENPRAGEFGLQYPAIQQAYADRVAILKLIERLSPSERNMLPDDVTQTVEGLYERASDLARTLHAMDTNMDTQEIANIDQRIAATEREKDDEEKTRRLSLLESKKRKIVELQGRKDQVARHMESCMLAMQNVRFDLLRLRSSDAGQAMGDLTQATMQARALSRDVDVAIATAAELRDAM
ncbi:MAG: protein kinase, partial [Gemmatimonadota bacterium]